MFAVVEINDKQHMVKEGDVLTIDGNIDKKKITYSNVLLITDGKDTKIVFKFKRKTGYKLTRGHRQNSTVIKIKSIKTGDK